MLKLDTMIPVINHIDLILEPFHLSSALIIPSFCRRLLVALCHRVTLYESLTAEEGGAARTELPGRIQWLLHLQSKWPRNESHGTLLHPLCFLSW